MVEPEQLEIREVRRRDYREIISAIAETWGYYKRHKNPVTARLVARAYWYGALLDHTFSAAAIWDGQCAGVLLGRCDAQLPKHQGSLRKYRRRALLLRILLSLSAEVRASSAGSERIEQADQKMLEDLRRRFDGELVFFVLRREYRRRGIGSALLNSFLEYMRANHCRSFYVFTDESCDFPFYDKRGFTRVGDEAVQLPDHAAPSHFYLNQYTI